MSTAEDTILSQYVPGFKANLDLAPQQTDTRLLGTVDSDLAYDTPGQMFNADDVQTSDPEAAVGRVPDTPDKFIAMTRRIGFFAPFQDSAWLDNVDKARELVDPTNKIMMSLMAGRWRYVDKAIIAAALGLAYSRLDAASAPTATALPAGQVIASTDVSAAHDGEVVPADGSQYGLSVGKILKAGFLLDESELEGQRHWVGTSQQKMDLLRRTPVTSRYYTDVQALVGGKIDEFMGFRFHWLKSTRVPSAGLGHDGASAIRQNIAYIQDAICYRGRPITDARIAIRHDKSDTPQAFYKTEHGGVRRYDSAVVEVDCYEGAAY
jgi:hypothetical protein